MRGQKRIFQANGCKKQAGVAILVSDKIGFKPKLTRRDSEGQYRLIKGKIHQEDTEILNICVPNTRAFKSVRETGLQLAVEYYFKVCYICFCCGPFV